MNYTISYIMNGIICFFIGHKYKYSVYDKHRRKCGRCNKKQYKIDSKWSDSNKQYYNTKKYDTFNRFIYSNFIGFY